MAQFWISLFIRLSWRLPWLMRWIRPLGLRIAWWSSRPSRDGTTANAKWLLGVGAGLSERRALGRAVMGSFYDFLLDLGRCRGMSGDELAAEAESVEGLEGYREVRALRRGAIVLTAHLGSFEVGAAGLRRREPRVHVVFRRDPMDLFETLRSEQRRRLGVIEASVEEGWMMWVGLRDALLADEVVMMQGDRLMAGQRGMDAPFLGGHIAVPTGPARLALATGAPIVPVFSIRGASGRIRVVLEPAVWVEPGPDPGAAVERATLAVTRAVERHVAAHPEQWLMIRRVWREDLTGA
jgi:KDO2-lipid IV(A) lauroyltransferase